MCSHSESCSPVINTVCRRRCCWASPGPRQQPTLSEWHKLKERFKLTTHCGWVSGAEPAPLASADQTAGDNDLCCFQDRDIWGSSPPRGLSSFPTVSPLCSSCVLFTNDCDRAAASRMAGLTCSVLLFAPARKAVPPPQKDKVQWLQVREVLLFSLLHRKGTAVSSS